MTKPIRPTREAKAADPFTLVVYDDQSRPRLMMRFSSTQLRDAAIDAM